MNFHESWSIVTFWSNELRASLDVSKGCESLCPDEVEGYGFPLDSPQGFRSSLHLVRWIMCLHLSHCRETRPSFESGHLGVHCTWGKKQRVPLTYLFWGKVPLEVFVESWLTSSFEERESYSSRDDMGSTELSSSCSTEIDDPLYLRRLSQGISRGS